MSEVGTGRVILDKTGPIGHAYVELFDDGRVRAGYYKDTAKLWGSADKAYARFRQSVDEAPNHSAWNICYALEDYLTQRDDAR